jgi:hypothetical protein
MWYLKFKECAILDQTILFCYIEKRKKLISDDDVIGYD